MAVKAKDHDSIGSPPGPGEPDVWEDVTKPCSRIYFSASKRPPAGPRGLAPGRLTRMVTIVMGSPAQSLDHRRGVLLSITLLICMGEKMAPPAIRPLRSEEH